MNVLSYHYFGDEIVKIDEAREYDHVFRPRFDSDLLHIPFNKLNLTFNPNGDGDIFHFQYKTLGSSYELEILKKLYLMVVRNQDMIQVSYIIYNNIVMMSS